MPGAAATALGITDEGDRVCFVRRRIKILVILSFFSFYLCYIIRDSAHGCIKLLILAPDVDIKVPATSKPGS